jgi:isoleucyl-tRNA synthetase
MDKLYRDLTQHNQKFDSVHLAEFPKYVENFVNKSLEVKCKSTNHFIISFITT